MKYFYASSLCISNENSKCDLGKIGSARNLEWKKYYIKAKAFVKNVL